jgi:hypothetical protein
VRAEVRRFLGASLDIFLRRDADFYVRPWILWAQVKPFLSASLDISRPQIHGFLGASLDIARAQGRRFYVRPWILFLLTDNVFWGGVDRVAGFYVRRWILCVHRDAFCGASVDIPRGQRRCVLGAFLHIVLAQGRRFCVRR